jgi:hypothetical protein
MNDETLKENIENLVIGANIMKITRIDRYRNPNRIKRKVLLDTDQVKNKPRHIVDRIEDAVEALDVIEKWADRQLTRICDIIT